MLSILLSILLFCNNEMSVAYISTCVEGEKLSLLKMGCLNQKFKDPHKNLEDEKMEKGKRIFNSDERKTLESICVVR